MKKRVTSFLLAILAVMTVVLPAYADEVANEAAPEEGQADSNAYSVYNGESLLESVRSTSYNGVCYVTVDSFLAALDAEAMVEKEEGVVTVTAAAVAQVVDVEGTGEAEIEADEALVDEQPEAELQPDPEAESGAEKEKEEEEPQLANVVEETLTLSAGAGEYYVVANGRYLYVEDGTILVDGEVAVPIRVLAKAFNMNVKYVSKTRSVVLTHQEGASAYLTDGSSFYDDDTLYWLSRIIYSESGNQSLEGRIAVGNVVMNRLNNPRFPNTIYEVLFQKNQFSPAASGSIYREPSEGSVIAAKLVMDGAESVDGALFFNRAGMNTYAARNRRYVTTIGAHAFYA